MSQSDHLPDNLSILAQVPGLDVKRALQRFRGNEKLFAELLALFIKNHTRDAEKIRDALARADQFAALNAAHSLKSVSAMFGAVEVAAAAAAVEQALQNGDVAACPPLVEQLAVQMDVVNAALARWSSGA